MIWLKRGIWLVIGVWLINALLPHYRPGTLEVWMLNVGQGESVLAHEPSGKLLLYDGGPDDSVLQQLGAILPPWQRRINLVVLSHDHSDHITGLISVLERYQVDEIWTSGARYNSPEYYRFEAEIKARHIPQTFTYFHTEDCQSQPVCPLPIHFGQTILQVYHPLKNMVGANPRQPHDATLSLKISFQNQSVFLTGDLNEEHEQDMLNGCQPPRCSLQSTVLQVPHHGSATGLLPSFLAAVSPKDALIPVGLHNKFHHPRAETLAKLSAANIPYWRTDLNGRIHLILGASISVQPEHPT